MATTVVPLCGEARREYSLCVKESVNMSATDSIFISYNTVYYQIIYI